VVFANGHLWLAGVAWLRVGVSAEIDTQRLSLRTEPGPGAGVPKLVIARSRPTSLSACLGVENHAIGFAPWPMSSTLQGLVQELRGPAAASAALAGLATGPAALNWPASWLICCRSGPCWSESKQGRAVPRPDPSTVSRARTALLRRDVR